ncbi:unnamed protein product, partial [Laminaria digitata]
GFCSDQGCGSKQRHSEGVFCSEQGCGSVELEAHKGENFISRSTDPCSSRQEHSRTNTHQQQASVPNHQQHAATPGTGGRHIRGKRSCRLAQHRPVLVAARS